jgi:presenilin-like A22 family membrane protease
MHSETFYKHFVLLRYIISMEFFFLRSMRKEAVWILAVLYSICVYDDLYWIVLKKLSSFRECASGTCVSLILL